MDNKYLAPDRWQPEKGRKNRKMWREILLWTVSFTLIMFVGSFMFGLFLKRPKMRIDWAFLARCWAYMAAYPQALLVIFQPTDISDTYEIKVAAVDTGTRKAILVMRNGLS